MIPSVDLADQGALADFADPRVERDGDHCGGLVLVELGSDATVQPSADDFDVLVEEGGALLVGELLAEAYLWAGMAVADGWDAYGVKVGTVDLTFADLDVRHTNNP